MILGPSRAALAPALCLLLVACSSPGSPEHTGSTAGAITWNIHTETVVTTDLGGGGYLTSLVHDAPQNEIFALTDNAGVFRCDDKRLSCEPYNSGLPSTDAMGARSLFVASDGTRYLAAGISQSGVHNLFGVYSRAAAASSWTLLAGRQDGLASPTEFQTDNLAFDGSFSSSTHASIGTCRLGSSRPIAAGSLLAEATGSACGGAGTGLVVAAPTTLSPGGSTGSLYLRCGGTWTLLASLGYEPSAIVAIPSVSDAFLLGAVDGATSALSWVSVSGGTATLTPLSVAGITDVRDIAMDSAGDAWVAAKEGLFRVTLTAGSPPSAAATAVIPSSSLNQAGELGHCATSSEPDRTGVFTSVRVTMMSSGVEAITASHLGGEVFVSMDGGTNFTQYSRDGLSAGKFKAYGSGAAGTALSVSQGSASYTSNFLASPAAALYSDYSGMVFVGDFYGAWKIDPASATAERTTGLENTFVQSVAVRPSGGEALVAKSDAPLLARASATTASLTALTAGAGTHSSALPSCLSGVTKLGSVVWPSDALAYTAGHNGSGYSVCAIANPSNVTPTFSAVSTTSLPTSATAYGLGTNQNDPADLYFVADCNVYRLVGGQFANVYSASSSGYPCRSTASSAHSIQIQDAAATAKVVRLTSGGTQRDITFAVASDRIIVDEGGGFYGWNRGLMGGDNSAGVATDAEPIGYASGGRWAIRLTALEVSVSGATATVYVGTSPECADTSSVGNNSWYPYANSSTTATNRVACPSSQYAGGVYKRTLTLDATGAITYDTAFTNLIQFAAPNITVDGTTSARMFDVSGIRDLGSGRLLFTSRVQGKVLTNGFVPHVGGEFLSEDGGTTWVALTTPLRDRTKQVTSMAVDGSGNVFLGTQGNGLVTHTLSFATCDTGGATNRGRVSAALGGFAFDLDSGVVGTAGQDIEFSYNARRRTYVASASGVGILGRGMSGVGYTNANTCELSTAGVHNPASLYPGGGAIFVQTQTGAIYKVGNVTVSGPTQARVIDFDYARLQ